MKDEKEIPSSLTELHERFDSLVSYQNKISTIPCSRLNVWGKAKEIHLNHLHDLAEEIGEIRKKIRSICSSINFPEVIKCPHCGYVHLQESDKKEPWPYLRILELVLRPHKVISYDPKVGSMKISDHVEESFDPFDNISSPQHEGYMDEIGDSQDDGSYRAVRIFARGRALFVCGQCLGYFDASRIKRNMFIDVGE